MLNEVKMVVKMVVFSGAPPPKKNPGAARPCGQ